MADIWDRLDRAQEHFQRLEGMLLDYYRSGVGEIRGEFNPDLHQPIPVAFDSSDFNPPPHRMHTIVGELLHDLRSSLEHLAWALVEANGGNPTSATSFPVLQARPAPNRQGIHRPPGVAGGVSAAAAAVIDRAQPYTFGPDYADHPVWVLDKLWNIDKHRHVTLAGIRMGEFAIPDDTSPFVFTMRTTSVAVDRAELVLAPHDPTVNVDIRTTIEVFLVEPQDGIRTPLYWTLEHLIEATTGIVTEAQDACF